MGLKACILSGAFILFFGMFFSATGWPGLPDASCLSGRIKEQLPQPARTVFLAEILDRLLGPESWREEAPDKIDFYKRVIRFEPEEFALVQSLEHLLSLAMKSNKMRFSVRDIRDIFHFSKHERVLLIKRLSEMARDADAKGKLNAELLQLQLRYFMRSSASEYIFSGSLAQIARYFPDWLSPNATPEVQAKKIIFLRSALSQVAPPADEPSYNPSMLNDLAVMQQWAQGMQVPSRYSKLVRRSQKTFHGQSTPGSGAKFAPPSAPITGADSREAFANASFLKIGIFSERERKIIAEIQERSKREIEKTGYFSEHGVWLVTLRSGEQFEVYVAGIGRTIPHPQEPLRKILGKRVRNFRDIVAIQMFHTHPPGDRVLSGGDAKAAAAHFQPDDSVFIGLHEAVRGQGAHSFSFHVYAVTGGVDDPEIHHMGFDKTIGAP